MKKAVVISSVAAATAAVGAAVGSGIAYMKKNDICPRCEIKKKIAAAHIHYTKDELYNNGVCLTPPMGWSSWNLFHNKIDENVILDIAKAVEKSGLADAGYIYINLDDCWHSSMRDENGRLQGDLTAFPHGIKWLADEVNGMGMKLGIYSSNGTLTCEDLPASLGHERIDAETFAEWGIEYFKYDFCHNIPLPTAAPFIDSVLVGGNYIENDIAFKAEDARLTGEAKLVVENEEKGEKYVKGLCSGLGSMNFDDVCVDEDGEYVLTIIVRKEAGDEKYAVVTVNNTDKYEFFAPKTNAWNRERRHQIMIKLRKGRNTISISNPVGSKFDSAALLYERMGKELKRATKNFAEKNGCEEKKMLFSICEWGANMPWKWAEKAGNIWRTTGDIAPHWASVLGIYEVNVRLDKYAQPGAFNDPDMLEVGNGKLTYEENKSHFTLWAMMAAPLILGNDIRLFIKEDGTVDTDNKILGILTNKDVIAIDQDKRGIQCKRVKTNAITDVLVKPLENNEVAVCFFNKGKTGMKISCKLSDIHNMVASTLPKTDRYVCRELWDNTTTVVTDVISADVPSHGVKVFRVSAKK